MNAPAEYQDYLTELREHVCSHCIERREGCPPCAPHGKRCGIELHLPEMVQICRTTDNVLMDPYILKLHDVICKNCEFHDTADCPCPLDYLLELAVESIERVERRRLGQTNGVDRY